MSGICSKLIIKALKQCGVLIENTTTIKNKWYI